MPDLTSRKRCLSRLQSQDEYGNQECARDSFNLPLRTLQGIVPCVSEVSRIPSDNHYTSGYLSLRVICQKFEENRIDQPLMANLNFNRHVRFDQIVSQLRENE